MFEGTNWLESIVLVSLIAGFATLSNLLAWAVAALAGLVSLRTGKLALPYTGGLILAALVVASSEDWLSKLQLLLSVLVPVAIAFALQCIATRLLISPLARFHNRINS